MLPFSDTQGRGRDVVRAGNMGHTYLIDQCSPARILHRQWVAVSRPFTVLARAENGTRCISICRMSRKSITKPAAKPRQNLDTTTVVISYLVETSSYIQKNKYGSWLLLKVGLLVGEEAAGNSMYQLQLQPMGTVQLVLLLKLSKREV